MGVVNCLLRKQYAPLPWRIPKENIHGFVVYFRNITVSNNLGRTLFAIFPSLLLSSYSNGRCRFLSSRIGVS